MTWNEVNSGLASKNVYEIAADNSNLYARFDGSIYYSTNLADSWTSLNALSDGGFYSAMAVKDSNIFLGTSRGNIIRSTNNGKNWYKLGTYSTDLVQSIVTDGEVTFYNTSREIYRSTNNGTSWSWVKSGLPDKRISSIELYNSIVYTGISRDGIYYSSNNGSDWNLLGKVFTYSDLRSVAVLNSYLIAAAYEGIYSSTDNGNNWSLSISGLPSSQGLPAVANDGTNFYAGTASNGIYLSTNNGANWSPLNSGISQESITSITLNESKIYAGTAHNGIFNSSNNGINWFSIQSSWSSSEYLFSIALNKSNLYAATEKGEVYQTSDDGSSWQTLDWGTSGWTINGFVFSDNNIFIVSNGSVYFSRDDGKNWRIINEGLPNSNASNITYDESYLYVTTSGAGIWQRNIQDIITHIDEEEENIPSNFQLFQNYPNPFNPSTTIEYAIPNQSHVTIKVYDLLGREVTTLINEEKPAGNYSVTFDGGGLVSGIYFYRLTSNKFSETKKLLLLR